MNSLMIITIYAWIYGDLQQKGPLPVFPLGYKNRQRIGWDVDEVVKCLLVMFISLVLCACLKSHNTWGVTLETRQIPFSCFIHQSYVISSPGSPPVSLSSPGLMRVHYFPELSIFTPTQVRSLALFRFLLRGCHSACYWRARGREVRTRSPFVP